MWTDNGPRRRSYRPVPFSGRGVRGLRPRASRLALRPPRGESGYSIVEVTVAMVVLALAVIPLVGLLESGLRAATVVGRYDEARALANAKLEGARALPYDRPDGSAESVVERYAPPGPPGGEQGGFDYAIETAFVDGELADTASPTGQMRLEVSVSWDTGSYTTTGFVFEGQR